MRAYEFITEQVTAPSTRHHQSTAGLNVFTDSDFDRIYTLNRVMMAAASTDGKSIPTMNDTSWNSKHNTAHPYTQEEQDMLNIAYKVAGVPMMKDLNKGDLKSKELESTHINSPIKPFKGYKK